MTPPAPQRAQRVRGVPGVGLRTPDGSEWLRWGRGFRHDPDNCDPVLPPHWVIARCTHPGGGEPCDHDTGLRWTACDDCCRIADPFTVRYCGRPTRWGNPFSVPKRPSTHPDGQPYWPVWVCVIAGKPIVENVARTRLDALRSSIDYFAEDLDSVDNAYFTGLLGYDYLSCFCPLDQPCHVDAIIAEGVARGLWTPNGHHEP